MDYLDGFLDLDLALAVFASHDHGACAHPRRLVVLPRSNTPQSRRTQGSGYQNSGRKQKSKESTRRGHAQWDSSGRRVVQQTAPLMKEERVVGAIRRTLRVQTVLWIRDKHDADKKGTLSFPTRHERGGFNRTGSLTQRWVLPEANNKSKSKRRRKVGGNEGWKG